jgi:hypothetical protein
MRLYAVIWILLVILTVLGSTAAVGYAVSAKRRALPGGGSVRALPAGSGDKLFERGLRDLRIGDVLTIDSKDFLCEGRVDYDEDGHRWIGGRIVDGSDIRWLVVGIERAGNAPVRLMVVDPAIDMSGYPPEAIVAGETRFTLDKRGTATCKLAGDVGGLAGAKDRPEGHVERCRWWLYSAPGDDTLIVEQWGADYRVLRGAKVNEGTIDLIPGS